MKWNVMKWKKKTNNYENGFLKKDEGTENDNNYESGVFFVERRTLWERNVFFCNGMEYNVMKWNIFEGVKKFANFL